MAVTESPVREEQLLHDMCLLGAVTVEITQMLTRASLVQLNPSKLETGLVSDVVYILLSLHTHYMNVSLLCIV